MSHALELRGISKRFGRTVALNNASLSVGWGQVAALLGENGAGKTTLARIAFGLLQPDAGDIAVNGTAATLHSPADALAQQIGMVHQHFALVAAMSVVENVALGQRRALRLADVRRELQALSQKTGLAVDPDAIVGELPLAAQQRVEILKSLSRGARILLLDEPTAVLAPTEIDDLMRWVRRFADEGGAAVLITHKLREARAIANTLTVLRGGTTVGAWRVDGVSDQEIVAAMIGEMPPAESLAESRPPGERAIAVELNGVAYETGGRRWLNETHLTVHAGEILGVAAVEGSGQAQLLRLLAGRAIPTRGEVQRPKHVAFIPEDRHRDAVVLEMDLVENLALRELSTRRGRMPWDALEAETRQMLGRFDVRASGIRTAMRALSGGNQQKFVIGREFSPMPQMVVAENPTRGLDIKASASVHAALRAARAAGAAIVLHSTDLDEVLAVADRVVVVHRGDVTEVARERAAVGRAMVGA